MKTPYVALVFERQESRFCGLFEHTVRRIVPLQPGMQVAFWEKTDDTGMHHRVTGTGSGSHIERIYHDDEGNVRIDVKVCWGPLQKNPSVATIKLEDVVDARVMHSRPHFMRGR